MTPMQWIVEQQARAEWLPATPETGVYSVLHACDQTWRSLDEITRLSRCSKSHCALLLRDLARLGKIEKLPARGNIPAQFRRAAA